MEKARRLSVVTVHSLFFWLDVSDYELDKAIVKYGA
jgi:hypothetical protein